MTCNITENTKSVPNFQSMLNNLEIFLIFWSECQTKVADETESEKLIVPLLLYISQSLTYGAICTPPQARDTM